jgi:hypothetical protein
VLLIKGFDRVSDGRARSTRTAPSTCRHAADASPRESIELRTLRVIED